jgi:hypothetical protein
VENNTRITYNEQQERLNARKEKPKNLAVNDLLIETRLLRN